MSALRPALKKRLGQHHLVDGKLCAPLLAFLRPAGERVVEIGPGGGVLTAELLAAGARVWAWELDLEWACHLRRAHPAKTLKVIAADAAWVPWERAPAPTLVAGNLPFNVGTRLIERLLPHHARVPRAAFMVQKEVAERLAAGPGDPAYGSLSAIAAAFARVAYLGTVRPGSFRPPPRVAAAFVGLELRPPPVAEEAAPALVRFLRQAFSQRRKTLPNSLGPAAGIERAAVAAALGELGRPPRSRAEELSLAEHVALFERLAGDHQLATKRPKC